MSQSSASSSSLYFLYYYVLCRHLCRLLSMLVFVAFISLCCCVYILDVTQNVHLSITDKQKLGITVLDAKNQYGHPSGRDDGWLFKCEARATGRRPLFEAYDTLNDEKSVVNWAEKRWGKKYYKLYHLKHKTHSSVVMSLACRTIITANSSSREGDKSSLCSGLGMRNWTGMQCKRRWRHLWWKRRRSWACHKGLFFGWKKNGDHCRVQQCIQMSPPSCRNSMLQLPFVIPVEIDRKVHARVRNGDRRI